MLGLSAAFVFAAQMLNFPIAAGTSGHLLGGVLTAILLGPSAAVVVMTCVLVVQSLVFADGGLVALGANIFNMGIVASCGGWLVFRFSKRFCPGGEERRTLFAAAFAGWFGTVLSAVSCAGQLAMSGIVSWQAVFPAMAGLHMLIGVCEGLATALIVAAVMRHRPALVRGLAPESMPGKKGMLAYGVLIIVGLAVFVAPHASSLPDGLETAAQQLGFEGRAVASPVPAVMTDYQLPWVGSPAAATAVAGAVGTVIALFGAYLLAWYMSSGGSRARRGWGIDAGLVLDSNVPLRTDGIAAVRKQDAHPGV
jgi:cobalt/nickel transport system permease protein